MARYWTTILTTTKVIWKTGEKRTKILRIFIEDDNYGVEKIFTAGWPR